MCEGLTSLQSHISASLGPTFITTRANQFAQVVVLKYHEHLNIHTFVNPRSFITFELDIAYPVQEHQTPYVVSHWLNHNACPLYLRTMLK